MRTTNVFYSFSKYVLGTYKVKHVFESKVPKVQWQRQGAEKLVQ